MSKRYCIDIDGTICTPTVGRDYHKAEPWQDRIKVLNKLYDEGNYIIYFTARAMGRFSGHSHTIFMWIFRFKRMCKIGWK